MSPGTLWLRSLRRVDRRKADLDTAIEAVRMGDLVDADYQRALWLEAIRLANRLAPYWNPNRRKRGQS